MRYGQTEDTALTTYSKNWLAAQIERPLTEKQLSAQLMTLQTAFPTVVRNYEPLEFKAMQMLWYEIFKNVPEEIMREAIRRFIINDRKGFFPSPGQIVGCIEQIVKEEQDRRDEIATQEHLARLREYQRLVEIGENCGNCCHCRHEWVEPSYADENYDKFLRCYDEEEKKQYYIEKFYCENRDSHNYEDESEHKWETSNTKRCDLFRQQALQITAGGDNP
ncbi:hypothetical protein AGMMS49975_05900 [Clostridia bacterium]|nr:hypothetical protein AGMMS49975_05900 [Clostridia bacterium]